MNRTKTEYVDYTINPVKGKCPMACSYCYARRMYDRFKWNPEIRFERLRFTMPDKPSRFFVGSTIELFGEWVKREWLAEIFGVVKCHPTHTFIFLTKCPQNLVKWSPFPKNCWVGVTATNAKMFKDAFVGLSEITARVKFISIEPMLERIYHPLYVCQDMIDLMVTYVDWLIIGQQTPVSKKTEPKLEWIKEIVEAADKASIPVFLKDNLKPLLNSNSMRIYENLWRHLDAKTLAFPLSVRQEMPR